MTESEKNVVLSRLRSFEVDKLIQFISEGHISLEEMKATGKLDYKKQAEIREKIERIQQEEEAERERQALERARAAEMEHLFSNLRSRDEHEIRQLVESGKLTPAEIVNRGVFSEDTLNKIINPPIIDTEFHTWQELKPLPPDRTDVYVFGVPGSGKSCMLGGLLTYANRHGKTDIDTYNPAGFKYKEELIKRIKNGLVPMRTSADVLNYINTSFKDDSGEPHPLSIIEMSGELFTQTYHDSGTGDGTIGARGYLHNNNRKILFFVVDYQLSQSGGSFTTEVEQSSQLEMALGLLREDGTLRKTDAVFVVVTKADLMEGGAANREAMNEFLDREYKNLITNVADLSRQYGFRAIKHPFSLGKFEYKTFFSYDETFSRDIYHDLVNLSFKPPKKRWGGIF